MDRRSRRNTRFGYYFQSNFVKYFLCCVVLGFIFTNASMQGIDMKLVVFTAFCCYILLTYKYRDTNDSYTTSFRK
jgi:ABC-type xylose transport system permease subunit